MDWRNSKCRWDLRYYKDAAWKLPWRRCRRICYPDYEGFEGLNISEYEGIQSAHDKAVFIEEHGALGGAVASHLGGSLDDAKRALEEGYIGEYRSIEDYAREITEDCHELPAYIENYIDYEAMGRDMEMNGDFFTIELGYRKLHLFHNL